MVSGSLKNRSLLSPADSLVRPTSDKVRAALFSSLGDVECLRFLDLFAGSGAVGIEAYSRGALYVCFVEKLAGVLRRNLKLLPKESYRLIEKDIFKHSFHESFNIIFADPPYGLYKPEKVLNFVKNEKLLAEGGILVYEESVRTLFSVETTEFDVIKERRYGDTVLYYLSAKESI